MVSSAWKNKRVRGAMDSVLGLLGSRRQQNPHGPRHRVVVIGGATVPIDASPDRAGGDGDICHGVILGPSARV